MGKSHLALPKKLPDNRLMTIFETCTPRQSVFDRQRRDTVLNLSDLLDGTLDESAATQFFAENYVTEWYETPHPEEFRPYFRQK